nr:putative ribonuclease H-like domain-containing protein [Tanacetum cinerariifolium]
MRIDELYKFSDGMLNDVRNALDDRLKGIRIQYFPTTIWRRGDKDRATAMIQAIEKKLKTRRILRSLEKFVGGRLVEVLRYDKKEKSEKLGRVPTETELILEHTQQGIRSALLMLEILSRRFFFKLNLSDHSYGVDAAMHFKENMLIAPTTAEHGLARKNELKARGTLLMALPDKHQLKFNTHKDAKTLMEAIEKRLQKLISQLEILRVSPSKEDINLKFLGSLHSKWRTHTLIWRNKIDLEEQSLDDLFNSLKIYEAEVKSSSSASTTIQNIAFVSSSNTDSTNEPVSAAASVSAVSAKLPVYALLNIDADDLEEMDLKWQIAMLTVECYNCNRKGHFARECRSPKDTRRNAAAEPQRRNVPVETTTSNALVSQCDVWAVMTGVFKQKRSLPTMLLWPSHIQVLLLTMRLLVYQQNESVFEEDIKLLKLEVQLRDNALVSLRQNLEKAEQERNDLKLKLEKFQTSSKNLTELLASQTHAKTSLGYNSQIFTCAMFDCDDYLSSESNESLPPNPIYDRYQSGNGYHAVPPPYTRIFMPPKPNLVFNNASNAIDTDHLTFNVKLSPTKPDQDMPSVQHVKTSILVATPNPGNPQHALKDKGVIDSGCLRHMIRNMSYLSEFEELNGGYVAFGGNPKSGKISRKGKIRSGKFGFDDVYFVKELKFNLFSVSQMCDKKNSVLFTDTEYLVLSLEFKLPNDSQVLLRVPRENNMYNVNIKNIVPFGELTCLFVKATIDESNLWHRRLGHINFKSMNKLVKGYLVRGLPIKVFENDNTCVACKKGKKHKATCKTKPVSSVDQPLYRLHMDLFGPNFVKSMYKKSYCLVVTDDYRRFTWVFFLAFKDETCPILKTFITGFENQLSLKNRVLVTKPHNKTPYELLHGRTPCIGFMRPFGCLVTIFNTLDSLGKFNGKADEGFLVGYYVSSKSFRVFNSTTQFEDFSDNSINEDNAAGTLVPAVGQISPYGTNTFSATEDITYSDDENNVGAEADFNNLETSITVSPIPTTKVHKDHHVTQIIGDLSSATQIRSMTRVAKDQDGKSASTPIDTKKPLLKDPNGEDVDVHTYRSMIGSLMYLTSSRPDIMFCRVNTPRSNEDRLELNRIDGFLVNDVTRLQALVDKKKVVIMEASIRDALCLDDAKGVECLPNKEIFTELARMSYEKPYTNLTFYKAFFSSQWKFLIHTILQCMSAKRTSWNEFSSSMTSAVICLSSGRKFNFSKKQVGDLSSYSTKYTSPTLTQKVVDEVHDEGVPAAGIVAEGDVSAANDKVLTVVEEPSIPSPTPPTPPPQPSQDQPLTSQVHLTPPHSPQSPQHQPQPSHDDKIAQALEITKLKSRAKKLERSNKASKLKRLKKVGIAQRIDTLDDTVMDDVSKQGGIIANIDADGDVVIEDAKDVAVEKSADVDESADIQGRTTDDTITAASTTITAADVPILVATIAAASKITATPSRRTNGILVVEPKPLKKQAQIKQDEKYARELEAELNRNINWNEVIDHVQRKQKEDKSIKRYQALKKKPQTEAQARKNMTIYLKNTKEQMDEEDNQSLKRLNESQEEKAAKKQKFEEEVEKLKRHLQIVPNDDDDNNKPYYKIKRADGSHQLYLSFLSLLRNFDREDLEALWRLVKERFATTKPKNFSDDFLPITLGAMFEKLDIHAQI